MLNNFFSARISVHVWVYYTTLFVMLVDVVLRIADIWLTKKKEKRGKTDA